MSDAAASRVALVGTSLVEAGAGTGKTHTIVDLYVRFLLERRLRVPEILVVTYTVAATAELRGRIRRRLAELAASLESDADRRWLQEALHGFDQAAIFTIHGFCQRALQEHAFESGRDFEAELVTDSGPLLVEVAQDFWSRELHAAPRFIAEYASSPSVHLLPSQLASLAAFVAARPDAELRPARSSPAPDLGLLEKEWQAAFARVAPAWWADGDDVIELLARAAEDGVLNKTKYRPEKVRGLWRTEMADEMGTGRPGIARRFGAFFRLSASGLAVNKDQVAPDHPFFALCDELVAADAALEQGLEQWAANFRHDFAAYSSAELERRKQEREILFFDDLLQGLRAALAGAGGGRFAEAIRSRHPVALIDEFQDTDPVQYEIFRRVWHGDREQALVLIGDPKQAIYGFRGADILAYLEARGDAAGAVHDLRRNWRADPALVDGLNAVFGSPPLPFGRDAIPYVPAEAREGAHDALTGERIQSGLRILWKSPPAGEEELPQARDGGDLCANVAAEVAHLLSSDHQIDGRRLAAGDIAILTRTNRQARRIQECLRAHAVVAVLHSEESVFATHEASELERVMRAMAEPENPVRVRSALATTLLAREAGELLDLVLDEDGAAWDGWLSNFQACRRTWIERGFIQALQALWTQRDVSARLLERPDGERRVTNLLHLGELLQQAAVESRLGPQALLHWFARRRREAESSGSSLSEAAQLRLESDDDAVQLVTVHRSKGLQYPVTICPFLWDGSRRPGEPFVRFHDPETGGLVIDAGRSEESLDQALREAHEESLRLLYVALTRARHHCSVVWGRFQGAGTSPLAHVLHPLAPGEPGPAERGAAGRLRKRKTDALRADLDLLAGKAPGGLVVEAWDPDSLSHEGGPDRVEPEPPAPAFAPARARRLFSNNRRISSFSGLIAAAPESEGGHDYDALSTPALPVLERSDDGSDRVVLADFPAGALPGILVHEILEELDFRAPDELPACVADALSRRGFADSWCEPLSRALRDVLSVPLDIDQPASHLGALSRSDRIDEMEFMLPVSAARGGLGAKALARAFADHATTPWVASYAERAGTLGFATLVGHLRGFIDLVARQDGRFAVVDYKSNRLGPRVSDYAPEALQAEMVEHDYVLQYHLYLVALHRYLTLRLPDYDYDTHVSGARYLFVRGMSAAHPPGWGIVSERPPRALIEALSELLE